jgi:HEPN domain-containing protein
MRMLSNYYIESRYPEELASLGQIDQALAEETLRHTEEILEWLAGK